MPRCYPYDNCPALATVQKSVGVEQAYDVDRTYRLEMAGDKVR